MERDGAEAYMEWSTIVDAPVTYLVPIEEFEDYYRHRYGEEGMRRLPERMARVEETGCSAHDQSADDLILVNRAGPGEAALSPDEIWDHYYREDGEA